MSLDCSKFNKMKNNLKNLADTRCRSFAEHCVKAITAGLGIITGVDTNNKNDN